jgi:hypothetical protein
MPRLNRVGAAISGLGFTLGLLGAAAPCSAQGQGTATASDSGPRPEVAAQEPPRPTPAPVARPRWTIGLRGGLGLATNPTAGSGQLPAPGSSFSPTDLPAGAGPTRLVSSWLFGDGAAQLNAVVGHVPPLPALDGMLTSLGATRRPGVAGGVTIARDVSPHLSIGFNVDADLQSLATTAAAAAAIQATTTGFDTTFPDLLLQRLQILEIRIKTTATTSGLSSVGRQILASGTLIYRLRPGPHLDPFVTCGAGVITNSGAPAITLVGNYQFPVSGPGGVQIGAIQQTDTVTIHLSDGRSRPVGIVGGGIEQDLSGHTGFRFAVELAIGANQAQTAIDASPTPTPSSPAVDLFIFNPTATLVFNNQAQGSTLSGPALTNVKTFAGTGTRIQSSLTASYFFRF